MRKAKKMWIIIATACIVIGCIVAGAAAASNGFDFTKFNTSQFEKKTYTVNEPFANIDIQTTECSIAFFPSQKDTCEIIYGESDKITHSISVENDTLQIVRKDLRKWYERIGIFFSIDYELQVYLPQGEYDKLHAASVSGDITIPNAFRFDSVELTTTSGDISFESETKTSWSGKTVSGDVSVKNLMGESADIKTTSGEIEMEQTQVDSVQLITTSGDITMENTIAETQMFIKTTSGEVSMESCDSADIAIRTVSGDVDGSLRSDKQFITHTTSGDVRLPNASSSTQNCEVTTTSGDIRFIIE